MEEARGESIRIEQLEVFGRVGVTENERAKPQRLTLTLKVHLNTGFDRLEDDIGRTVNYSGLCVAAREFVEARSDKLVETLAAKLASYLLEKFPLRRVELELRKFVLPDAKHVAITVVRDAA